MQCSVFQHFHDSDWGFAFHCEKDPRPHQVFPSLPCLSPIFLGGTWEQTLLIKDLPKKRWNTKWNKAGTLEHGVKLGHDYAKLGNSQMSNWL